MLTRRRFAALAMSTSALSLTACGLGGPFKPAPQVTLPGIGIDSHVHLFNGTDVPVLGWLDQVNFAIEGGGNLSNLTKSPLIRLVVAFLAGQTRTARQELDSLPAALPRPSRDRMDADAVAKVADFLETYEAQAVQASDAFTEGRVDSVRIGEDLRLFDALADAAGVPQADPAAMAETDGMRQMSGPRARQIAEGLYEPANQENDPQAQTLAGLIRWAELMTRDRAVILQQGVALYGRATEARVFCNHLPDMTWWLTSCEVRQSDPDDLIRLFAALAQRRDDILLLNFVGFCPLRAAIEGNVALDRVMRAVEQYGFAGVKLYPPMGFKPIGNDGISFDHARGRPNGGGAALDRELHRLYRYCNDNGVAIASHASRSMGAGRGTENYAAPWLWQPVLAQYDRLHVNLAHFGGFDKHGGPGWMEQLAGMLSRFDNLYFDTGYWTEAMNGAPQRQVALETTKRLFALADPVAAGRMLYGSDWSMIARLPQHGEFLQDMLAFAQDLTEHDEDAVKAIMGNNARRWLGIESVDSLQARRLQGFYAGHPIWSALTEQ